MFTQRRLLGLVAIFIVGWLIACAPTPAAVPTSAPPTSASATQPTSAPAAQPTTAAQPSAAPSGEKKTVVYLSMFSEGESYADVLKKATADFMAENPDIDVQINWAGRTNLTQLQSLLAAGTQVDLVDHTEGRVYNAVVNNGLALPLDDYLATKAYDQDKSWRDSFIPGSFDILKGEDGKVYMVPRDDFISAIFYNAGMLDKMGIHPKTVGMTWDEFVAMLEEIRTKDPKVSPLGADGVIDFYNAWWFQYLGTRFAGPEAFYNAAFDKTGEAWGAPEFLEAAKKIKELTDKGFFQKGYEGSPYPAQQVMWVNDQVAMSMNWASLPAEMAPQAPPGFKSDLFAFPTVPGGKGNDYNEHRTNSYAVLKDSKNPDAAIKLLKYYTSQKVAKDLVNLGSAVAVDGVTPPEPLKNQLAVLQGGKSMRTGVGLERDAPEWLQNVMYPCDDQLFKAQITPEKFIDCLKTGSKDYWAKK